MFTSAIAFPSLVATVLFATADLKTAVKLEAEVGQDPRVGGYLKVKLVGLEKECSVITQGLELSLSADPGRATFSLTRKENKDEQGRLIIPPASKLGIVKLQSGEVAKVNAAILSNEYKEVCEHALAGKIELFVEYDIPEELAKRFGVVSGTFKVKAVALKK